jgi:hypothetical protein
MKRFFTAFLLIISIISSSGSIIYAENITEPGSKGVLEEITYSSDEAYEEVHIKTTGYSDYSSEILSNPDRIVIDLKNVEVPDGQGQIQANGTFVNRIRYSQFTSNTARAVVDVNKGYDYSVEETDTGLIIYICKERTASEIKNDSAIVFGRGGSIKKTGSGADEAVTIDLGGFEGYDISRRTDPETLVITIPDAGVFGSGKEIDVGGDKIRIYKLPENRRVRRRHNHRPYRTVPV